MLYPILSLFLASAPLLRAEPPADGGQPQSAAIPGAPAGPAMMLSPLVSSSAAAVVASAEVTASSDPADPAQATTPPPAPAPQATPPEATPAQSQASQDAAARVRARRAQRVAAIVEDIYTHKFEAYFGGGYVRFRPGDHLQHLNEVSWNVGATRFFGPKLGASVDFRGQYGTAYVGNNAYAIFLPSIYQYTFMAGPQYRLKKSPKLATSVRLLAGGIYGNFDGNTGGLPGHFLGLYPNGMAFSMSAGVPLDYNISPALAIRLTPEYNITTFGSSIQAKPGFTMNILYRFGRQ